MATIVPVNTFIQNEWIYWEPLCSPACDDCWKKDGGYHKRSSWLSEWMTCFIKNEDDIAKGLKQMPDLCWGTNSEANRKLCNLEECHKERCFRGKSYKDCNCSYSLLMREIWGNDATDEYGVIEILGRYKNLKKQIIC